MPTGSSTVRTTVQQIADVLGVGRSSVYRSLRLQGVVPGSAPVSEVAVDARWSELMGRHYLDLALFSRACPQPPGSDG
jgi:hypothetical protein